MRKLLFSAAASLLFVIGSALGADVAGKWTAEIEGRNGEKRVTTFNLKVDGDKLTGTVSNPMGDREISDGKISGDDISFAVKGNQRTTNYKGKVVGGELKLTIETPRGAREVTAKRVTS